MPTAHIKVSTPIKRTPRVTLIEEIFDIPLADESILEWDVDIPIEGIDWAVGIIAGPSGCGKSTIANEIFPGKVVSSYDDWPVDAAIVDKFPNELAASEVAQLLSSVGFSSPPSWFRPYRVLSSGEQFRVTVARALAENPDVAVVDEFTSVVDRTAAKIGSCAAAKITRRKNQRLVAVTCHYDVIPWMQPDWVYQPHLRKFTRRLVQRRPDIKLEVTRTSHESWDLFKKHHYLNQNLNHRGARCFVAYAGGRPAAFTAALPFPHPTSPGWREHRTVCLPDFQGVGIGNALSDYVASLMVATGKPYRSVTAHPGMIRSRQRSYKWRTIRGPRKRKMQTGNPRWSFSVRRTVASFEYCGRPNFVDAEAFGII